ncbi:MAG: HesA/MoeB/ThiF family protein, partial [Promethearchaeia archaeon]
DLKTRHVGIVGAGGLGTVSAEMATRCGVHEISLFDFDTVEVVNLNRLLYKEKHLGKSKVKVVKNYLSEINPDIKINTYMKDIMDMNFEKEFENVIKSLDLVLNGLDNIPARKYLNIKCIKLNIPYIDAGASRSGLSGYVHPVLPGKTACAECLSSIGIDLPDERGEPCVASLPSTMALLASVQIQEMLKFLLEFGVMIDYLMYDMVSGQFHSYSTERDQNCSVCGQLDSNRQEEEKVERKISKKKLNNIIDEMKEDKE